MILLVSLTREQGETEPHGGDDTVLDAQRGSPASSRSPLPATISRYLVIEELGAGAMGVVLRAYDPRLRREVALKLLQRREDAKAEARMLREAQSMAQLSHPNVVGIYDAETTEHGVMIAMELVAGVTLDRWLADEARSIPQILSAFVQAGRGLVAAHAAGLIHRDFKPANVFMGAGDDRAGVGRVRVGDFGLARETTRAMDAEPSSSDASSDASAVELTATGTVMGTPVYMAPEQHLGQPADERSDQFAFCVSLWEALHKERPFTGSTVLEFGIAKLHGNLKAPRAKVPARVQAAIERGLSAKPEDRWPDLATLLGRLEPRRRRWEVLALVATVAAAGTATALLVSDDAPSPREARCVAARQQLHKTWGDERRAALEADERSPARLLSALDAYAAELGEQYARTCQAPEPLDDLSFDVTMACLDTRTRHVEAVVELMSTGRIDEGKSVDKLIDTLTPIDRCAETQWMGTRRMLPDDPRQREQVLALNDDLTLVQRLEREGKYAEAIPRADEVVAEAEAIGFTPVIASALFVRSSLAKAERRYDYAAELLQRVIELQLSVGNDEEAIAAATDLVFVRGVHQDRYAEADGWAALVRGMMSRTDVGPFRRGRFDNHIGASMNARGEPEAALEPLHRAVDELTAALGPDHRSVSDPLVHLARALTTLGRAEEALAPARRAVELREAHYPPDSSAVIAARITLARAQGETGAHQPALDTLRRTLESLAERDDRKRKRAEIWRLMAELHERAGEQDAAAHARARAEALAEGPGG